ncbi:hypothetical protein BGZ76_000464 [Entomortierella beljakovae]|nr:hypothetical protein BGZ76_000464 [Entomortierella beljakovae]
MTFQSSLNERKPPVLPVQRPTSPRSNSAFHPSCKKSVFLFIAISSTLLLLNTAYFQLSVSPVNVVEDSTSTTPLNTVPSVATPPAVLSSPSIPSPSPSHNTDPIEEQKEKNPYPFHPYHEPEDVEPDEDSEEFNRFTDEDEEEEEEDPEPSYDPQTEQQRRQPTIHSPFDPVEGVVSTECPTIVLTTETSFRAPAFSSSSTTPVTSTSYMGVLSPAQVTCQIVPSQIQGYSLAFCISKTDCSRGFIQVVRKKGATDPMLKYKISKEASHDQHFRQVAGPDDFYFVLEGAQKLALGTHLVANDLGINTDGITTPFDAEDLVYRADFRMTLPGPVKLMGWLAYEKFRAVRENRPGVWPQWTHKLLVDPNITVDPTISGSATQFNICSGCVMDTFLSQVKTYRDEKFEQCDRMAPVRGAYWRDDLAQKVYSELDIINTGAGSGSFYQGPGPAQDSPLGMMYELEQNSGAPKPKLTRGWRFVPHGCTMTKTPSQPNASSRDPYVSTCDSILSPGKTLLMESEKKEHPKRRILFTGDSQVRATYNAILNHYRPIDPKRQKFAFHDEYIPGLNDVNLNNTLTTKNSAKDTTIPHEDTDADIRFVYRADQFLDFFIDSSDEELDRFDTIYINIGQWPASGPVAGGQWSTAKLLDRWEASIERMNRWKKSREEKLKARALNPNEPEDKNSTIAGSGDSSIVIWAGMNAFPMRTDNSIKVKGDWRTNSRLGYWDDWIETISQEEGNWFKRMNSWQLTFPMLDQSTDKAHFQETDAIDGFKIEALYKIDLCSKMQPDTPYPKPLADST